MTKKSSDNTAKIWDGSSGKLIQKLEDYFDDVLDTKFSSYGNFVVTGCEDGRV